MYYRPLQRQGHNSAGQKALSDELSTLFAFFISTLQNMAKAPRNVGGFTVSPIELPPSSVLPIPSKHYIYLKAHDPQFSEPDAARSLFIANVPVTATELHFKHLFGTQLATGRVERVDFNDTPYTFRLERSKSGISNGRKRKRVTEEDMQAELQSHQLPTVWTRTVHASGSHAV